MVQKKYLKEIGIKDERTDKFYKVENIVIDNFERFPSAYHIAVYNVIVKMGNRDGYCYPSYKTIGKYARCSPRKVMAVIKDFVKTRVLMKILRFDGEKKINESNIYKIVDLTNEYGVVNDMHKGNEPYSQGVVNYVHKGSESYSHKKESEKKNQLKKNQRKTEE